MIIAWSPSLIFNKCLSLPSIFHLAWENSRHLATLPLVSPPNDDWETSAGIPYWRRVTTKIWVVLLIGWHKFPTRLFSQARFHPFYLVPWSLNLLVQREVPGGIWEGEYPLGNFLGKIKLITAQFQFTALFLPWNSSALFTTKFQADIAVKWGVALSSRVKTFFPLHIEPFGNWK